MTPWCEKRMAALDLETTDPDPEEARIVTATVALVGGGAETEAFTLMVDPGVEIPEGATAVHGITTERARAEGVKPDVALPIVRDAIRRPVADGLALVVFNARYDLTVLDREARRLGIIPLDRASLRVVDPLVIDKHLDRYRKGSRKLDALCVHYNAQLEEAHTSAADAIAAARLAWRIGNQADVVRRARNHTEAQELVALRKHWDHVRHDLDRLHEAQMTWAAFQAQGLAEHFKRQGKPEFVPAEWPVITETAVPA